MGSMKDKDLSTPRTPTGPRAGSSTDVTSTSTDVSSICKHRVRNHQQFTFFSEDRRKQRRHQKWKVKATFPKLTASAPGPRPGSSPRHISMKLTTEPTGQGELYAAPCEMIVIFFFIR